jgi:hypothetical protein
MRMIYRKLCLAALAMMGLGFSAEAAEWTRVAYDDAGVDGKQPHLVEGANYAYPQEVPAADAALRTVSCGSTVEFGYGGLNPKATYKVRFRFLSEKPRELREKANGLILLPSVKLETNKELVQEIKLPPASYAKGCLQLSFEMISGPNAVISDIELLSDDPKPLTTMPEPTFEAQPSLLTPLPAKVSGLKTPEIDLGGAWTVTFGKEPKTQPVTFPGELYLQGIDLAGGPGVCQRTFNIPQEWQGYQIKLRCDSLYSKAAVSVNGTAVGEHIGGFTSCEFDVTAAMKAGDNTIEIILENNSVADTVASGTNYARHPLVGILRPLRLVAVPPCHIASLRLQTALSPDFKTGTLTVPVTLANPGKLAKPTVQVVLTPIGIEGLPAPRQKALPPAVIPLQAGAGTVSLTVPEVTLWHAETPFLYQAEITLLDGGKAIETIRRNIGFRTIAIQGNLVLVNGRPVKLRGVARHEVHPLLGRATTPALIEQDLRLFRDGNCNYLRTSHYPPDELVLDLCDRLGIFVEEEAPVCWNWNGNGYAQQQQTILNATAEMMLRDRDHASVLYWSIANESRWGKIFENQLKLVRQLDGRPVKFSHSEYFGIIGDGMLDPASKLDIGTWHYPSQQQIVQSDTYFRPIIFDEWVHLNAYNVSEQVTDPGLRDQWGLYLKEVTELMQKSRGALGGAIWCGVDEIFCPPGKKPIGYGPWGPIDGWRRLKPEYWHMKMAYAPVVVQEVPAQIQDGKMTIPVESRYDQRDLAAVDCTWEIAGKTGSAKLAGAPQGTTFLQIPVPRKLPADAKLNLTFRDPRGFTIAEYAVPLATGAPAIQACPAPDRTKPIRLAEQGKDWLITGDAFTMTFSTETGRFTASLKDGKPILQGGLDLALVPLVQESTTDAINAPVISNTNYSFVSGLCKNWKLTSCRQRSEPGRVTITTEGTYDGVTVAWELSIYGDGRMVADYQFTLAASMKPRQYGIALTLGKSFDRIAWQRNGLWGRYPEDHIGRSAGTAVAFPHGKTMVDPYEQPELFSKGIPANFTWANDTLPFGSNDFRSTKHNVVSYDLGAPDGRSLRFEADGHQHARSWVDGDVVHCFLLDYSNGGAEHYLSQVCGKDEITIGKDRKAIGRVQFRLIGK